MFTDTANAISRFFYRRAFGILLLRVVTGLVFLSHGWMKLLAISQTVGMFAHMGFSPGTAYFIAWLEMIGGLALILGIATRFFAVAFTIEMLVATFLTGFSYGISFEFYLMMTSLAIALIGSGPFSVFKMECDNCGGFLCNGDSCAVEE